MSDRQALRSTILQQSDPIGTKQRFGLFSQPISTAIGDDGQYKIKLHPRGQNGKPVTELRNFYTTRTKSGQLDYFEPLKSLATSKVKDTFVEQGRRLLQQQNQRFNQGRKQASFYPSHLGKTLANSSYKYMQQNNPELNPKRNRGEDGKVISQPRNYYTNPMTKVERQVFKEPKHISDPYERKHQLQVELMKKNKALQGQAPFKPNSFLPKALNSDKKIYGLDVEIIKKPQKQTKLNIFQHQAPFKSSSPMKSGHGGFLSPFPKYVENPPKESKRIDIKPDEKGKFRSMSSFSSRPTPSITMMSMKRTMHCSLRR